MTEEGLEDLVNCFPVRLRNIIKEIWTDGKIGISSVRMKVIIGNTKVTLDDSSNDKKNFALEIPYAGKKLHWEVMFNDEDDAFAPDFEFTNDTFLSDPEPDTITRHIPTLANWNVNNSKSLVNVLRELLILYKRVQLSTLEEKDIHSRLSEEYRTLRNTVEITEENIEVYVEKNGCVHFLININVDFSCLPPYIQPVLLGDNNCNLLNPCEDTAALHVSFSRFDCSRSSADLQLSPRLEQVIGNASTLHIPKYNKDKGLAAFVVEIAKILSDRIEVITNHYTLKKEYIQVLLSRCGRSIVEYNNKMFSSASILCEIDSFPVLVCLNIGKNFPQEKPKVTIRSVFQMQNSKPVITLWDRYPYSPRWKPREMVDRLLNSLNEEVMQFQTMCQKQADKDKVAF